MMGANFEAGRIASDANVGKWHKACVQPGAYEGTETAALPTLGRVCRFIAGNPTRFRAAANAYF